MQRHHLQQHSQAPNSGWVRAVCPPARGGAPVGVWGKPTEARYIGLQTICSCQMLFHAGLLPSPSSISPYPTPKKNSLDLPKSHDPTRPGKGRGYATGHLTEAFTLVQEGFSWKTPTLGMSHFTLLLTHTCS